MCLFGRFEGFMESGISTDPLKAERKKQREGNHHELRAQLLFEFFLKLSSVFPSPRFQCCVVVNKMPTDCSQHCSGEKVMYLR